VGRGGGVGLALAIARAVSVPGTQGVGVKLAKAVSVPANQGVGLASPAARAVCVPPTYGVNVAVAADGATGPCEQAIRLDNKTKTINDVFILIIFSLLTHDIPIIRRRFVFCSKRARP
jgi:hypothetical protein